MKNLSWEQTRSGQPKNLLQKQTEDCAKVYKDKRIYSKQFYQDPNYTELNACIH